MNSLALFASRNTAGLGNLIAKEITTKIQAECKLGEVDLKNFSDGEIWVKFRENLRGRDVYIVASTNPPADNLMELLIMIDAARRASAERVTAVIPYFGYARQERKDQPRTAITAKLVANLIVTAGANRIVSMDLHASAIQGFVDIPFDHLYASPVFLPYFQKLEIKDLVVVSPDMGSIKRARAYAKHLNAGLAVLDKRRSKHNELDDEMYLIGNVTDKNVLMVDDIIDTAGTFLNGSKTLKKNGALNIYGACTHPVLSGHAINNLNSSPINELCFTDTLNPKAIPNNSKILSAAELLATAIIRAHKNESISDLFIENRN